MYLFLAVPGFCYCVWAFFSFDKRRLLFFVVRISSYVIGVWLLHSIWDFPRPGIEPLSRALAGRFFTSGPPGRSSTFNLPAQDREKYGSATAGTHIHIFEGSKPEGSYVGDLLYSFFLCLFVF